MAVQIYRLNASSYQNQSFSVAEREMLEKIPGVSYINSVSDINMQIPFILISNTHTTPDEIPKDIIEKTILMIHPNSGYDNFSVTFCENVKFPILVGNPVRSHPVAEYILSCLLNHICSVPNQRHWQEDRTWNRPLLRDQNILIVGMGMIGKILMNSLSPLCPNIKFYDPYNEDEFLKGKRQKKLIEKTKFDVVLMACSLNKKNVGMINKRFFESISEKAVIINAARGGLIVQKDLEQFLINNPGAFAYLDVFEDEPFRPSDLSNLKNINKTSHIAGVSMSLNNDIIQYEYHLVQEALKALEQKEFDQFLNDYSKLNLKNKTVEGILI
jgi:phosphoglycerate dehydrogenase-like enzyme